jgi:uncharacterized protein YlxW (UPF0749 family)
MRMPAPLVRRLRPRRPRTAWELCVPIVALAAGLLFATSATVSRGTNLRSEGTSGLVGLVRAAQQQVTKAQANVQSLDGQVRTRTDEVAGSDSAVARLQAQSQKLRRAAGLTALQGPGLSVTLDDAHGDIPAGIDPNDAVVHQSDLQAVVNALWAGGAEAISISEQRVIATSAVRCVGNTLLLNGRVYSPPFPIIAIGPADQMKDSLGRSPGVNLYRQAADALGLTYKVTTETSLHVPAYDTTPVLSTAKVDR